jgi:hypothetical protein
VVLRPSAAPACGAAVAGGAVIHIAHTAAISEEVVFEQPDDTGALSQVAKIALTD